MRNEDIRDYLLAIKRNYPSIAINDKIIEGLEREDPKSTMSIEDFLLLINVLGKDNNNDNTNSAIIDDDDDDNGGGRRRRNYHNDNTTILEKRIEEKMKKKYTLHIQNLEHKMAALQPKERSQRLLAHLWVTTEKLAAERSQLLAQLVTLMERAPLGGWGGWRFLVWTLFVWLAGIGFCLVVGEWAVWEGGIVDGFFDLGDGEVFIPF